MTFCPISKTNPLLLASASPRRKNLLEQLNLPFRSRTSRIEETGLRGKPEEVCRNLAEKKAGAVYREAEASWILGADTLVVVDDHVLGKPRDAGDACRMLQLLSGRDHRVMTGLCLLDPSGSPVHKETAITRVRFKILSQREIEDYVKTGEPFGKAGSYAVQGLGAFMVASIYGSYTNVVGLPLCALIRALLRVGALHRFPLPGTSS